MELNEDTLKKLKANFDESIDKCMSKEEIDFRWSKYRSLFQRLLKKEVNKIDRNKLSSKEQLILKRFKECFFSSNVQFRRMQRMLQLDVEVRNYLKAYPSIDDYLRFFEDGYNISNN